MMGCKTKESLGGPGQSSYMNLEIGPASLRRDTSPSSNGTNELIANLDHELLDVRLRAVKCLLRKLECGIVPSDSFNHRADLVDRCKRWLLTVQEKQGSVEGSSNPAKLEGSELEGVELVIQLFCTLAKHKEFRELLRRNNVDNILSSFQNHLIGDYYQCQLGTLLNAIVVGQYELNYEGSPSEWFDNKTCPLSSSRKFDMFKTYQYQPISDVYGEDRRSPTRGESVETTRNTPAPDPYFSSKTHNIPFVADNGWARDIKFFIPSVYLTGTDKRVIHSTIDSLSSTNDSLVLMTVSFIRDTLVMDYPPELFMQEPSLVLALAQVLVSRWSDHKIPYTALQTLMKISDFLRYRFTQLNSGDQYEVPTGSVDQHFQHKSNNAYYDYDTMTYSSRMSSKPPTSNPTNTDVIIDNFVQFFKSVSRSLLYTSSELHMWPIFDNFAFSLLRCVSVFPVDAKLLTMNLQGVLMELAHIWERKSDFHTIVGLCVVSTSILRSMKLHNENFIVSKDVRNMLRSISNNPIIRSGWPEIFEYFLQFTALFDPSTSNPQEQQNDSSDSENPDNHPKKRTLTLLYAIQNASSHDEVLNSVAAILDTLLPITFNLRFGNDSLSHILKDMPWRDTFYRFLCVEPRTEGDEELLSRVLNLFTFILQNVVDPCAFKWITPLCCEKSSTTLKLLGGVALQKEMRYGGTAVTDLFRSLLDFYDIVLKHENNLMIDDTKWELFQIYCNILHSLEQTSYSNFAQLTAITKCLANVTEDTYIQSNLLQNPLMPVALLHRLTDAILVLEANGSLLEGFKNNSALYYLSVCVAHVLIPFVQNNNFRTFNSEWIERCSRTFHILAMFPDARMKAQAFQICEIITSSEVTKRSLIEISFQGNAEVLLVIAYSAFVEPKHNSAIKFRAGNVVLNILNDEDTSVKLQLAKKLQQEFPVLIDASRLSSHSLWTSKLSSILKNRESEDKPFDASSGASDGIPFITPKVLTVLCKIQISYLQSLLTDSDEMGGTLQEATSSGVSQMMFRIILNHPLRSEKDSKAWLECCSAISSVFEALVNLSKLDRSVSVILIGEKKCLFTMFDLLDLEIQNCEGGTYRERREAALDALCVNILTLGTILCCDGGNNFEDFERVAWSQQTILFKKLTKWLNVSVPAVSRKCALAFTHAFLSVLSKRIKNSNTESESFPSAHPFLCRTWNDGLTFGQSLCEQLMNLLKHAVDMEERLSTIKALSALFNLSNSSVCFAVQHDLISFSIKKLQSFGNTYVETKGVPFNNSRTGKTLYTETLSYIQLLSCLFYVSSKAKILALKQNFPDILHKIFGWWMYHSDLLHVYVEALLNFTEKHPEGALALTMTSNIIGVGPRRVPTQQSILMEILGILEKELGNVESGSLNLKTVEIIFEFLKNICFVQECRNILLKNPSIHFLRKMHAQETKRWGNKQNTAKANYLEFLVHASVHPDVQNCLTKIPEGLEILVQLADTDTPPRSIMALKILRNLCFNPANRGRLLTENMLMPLLSHKLLMSTDLEDIELAAFSLWALIANYERGRLTAKKSYCIEGITKALERIRKIEQSTSPEEDLSRLISLLETVQKLIGSVVPLVPQAKKPGSTSSSRSSSESQL